MGGYSARYHAASLAAVFLALAIGILIGVGFGDDVVSGTTEELEQSLQGDVEDAREEAEDLRAELSQEREFAEAVYPSLVGGDLRGERVIVIALGGLSEDLADDIETALAPTGARLAAVVVVRQPPDVGTLAGALEGTRYARMRRDPEAIAAYGRVAGRQLVLGGAVIRRSREQLLSRSSGRVRRIDDIVLARSSPGELNERDAEATERLEDGLLEGVASTGLPTVAVERTDADESAVELFDSHDIPTVDNIDRVSGWLSTVFVLRGVEGNFGVKDTADELLPDLLRPSGGP